MNKYLAILKEAAPLFIGLLAVLLFRSEFLISLVVLFAIGATFYVGYEKNEGYLLLLGIVCGAVLEIGGDMIYQLQFWSEGSIFGKPVWLFLWWGYGFVILRRVGNLVVDRK